MKRDTNKRGEFAGDISSLNCYPKNACTEFAHAQASINYGRKVLKSQVNKSVVIMTSLALYSKERIEELRSRISLLECSLLTLKQDFWTNFDLYLDKGQTPPYIFPLSTFQNLNSFLVDLKTICEHVDPDFIPATIAKCVFLDRCTSDVLRELIKLQNVLAQRICSLGTMKLVEYQQILQIEYGTINKAYNAVDALSFELVERTLGSDWILNYGYAPISLFDSRGYEINIYSNVVSVPYYDSFRARFWPALAHETAHILVSILAEQEGAFRRSMLDGRISRFGLNGTMASPAGHAPFNSTS